MDPIRYAQTPTSVEDAMSLLRHDAQADRMSAKLVYALSNMSTMWAGHVKAAWASVTTDYRQRLLRHLQHVSETNIELNYQTLALLALSDSEVEVRAAALDLLWEDESSLLLEHLLLLADHEPSAEVRAAALSALGRFVLLGELGRLSPGQTERTQDAARRIWQDTQQPVAVRRRALEAYANCSRPDVAAAIEQALASDNLDLQASALFAMGRTCDTRWERWVMEALDHSNPDVRFEAIRASGELSLQAAVKPLIAFARDTDVDMRDIAIWSLGEIGGAGALRVLHKLGERAEADGDESLIELIEEAIGTAEFGGSLSDLDA